MGAYGAPSARAGEGASSGGGVLADVASLRAEGEQIKAELIPDSEESGEELDDGHGQGQERADIPTAGDEPPLEGNKAAAALQRAVEGPAGRAGAARPASPPPAPARDGGQPQPPAPATPPQSQPTRTSPPTAAGGMCTGMVSREACEAPGQLRAADLIEVWLQCLKGVVLLPVAALAVFAAWLGRRARLLRGPAYALALALTALAPQQRPQRCGEPAEASTPGVSEAGCGQGQGNGGDQGQEGGWWRLFGLLGPAQGGGQGRGKGGERGQRQGRGRGQEHGMTSAQAEDVATQEVAAAAAGTQALPPAPVRGVSAAAAAREARERAEAAERRLAELQRQLHEAQGKVSIFALKVMNNDWSAGQEGRGGCMGGGAWGGAAVATA